jgi:type IV pilus assembly protein PilC
LRGASVKLRQLTKQLRVMLASGMPLVSAMEFLIEDEDPRWSAVVESVVHSLLHGSTLSASLRRHPRIFPSYYVGSIASAEMSGQLVGTLGFLEEWLDRESQLTARLKKALTYPTLVLGLSLVMVLGLFNTVIPRLMSSFETGERAWPTELLMLMTRVLSGPVFYFALLLMLVAGVAIWRHPGARQQLVLWAYQSPLLGTLLCHSACLRYTATFVLLLESGGQLLPALRAAANSSGSPLLLADEARVVRGASSGDTLSELWAQRPDLYPRIMVQMAQLGESSSSLSGGLKSAIPYLEMETYSRLDRFLEMAEPALISGVALFIGFVAIAVILPIAQMTQQL